jgi:phage repressor protein C with HTH and peptisase S24 domain
LKNSEYSAISIDSLFAGNYYTLDDKEDFTPVLNNKKIPLVGWEAVAGFGNARFAIEKEDVQAEYIVPDFKDVDFMIPLRGSSMYPKYNAGDIVACRIIRESQFIQWNKTYIIATIEQGILCKRLKPSTKPDCYLAISDNKEYDPFDIPINEVTGIALIVGVIRLE